ncbi:ABC transporter ATP-binding protein [Nocardioides sp. BP30]|uniref:ABC transporter ATP-binding protein n=1 Tax=Nocardioides sp. BP30 TaxID=3036374 RepID=UPI002468A18B|nr:ABC transporter ATP-binding protein [Nocardioides sp. BP30]WGL51520.1 ABC transporter ATP-binding protein [Nocardioides sp. BP30]
MAEAIVAQHVTKDFVLRRHKTFKQMSVAKMRGQKTVDRFNAVDDVSFTIQQGESVGLMGLNGSGKSTLLKVISGVMRPNKGTLVTRGRIAGLIATGAGFQNQLSGLENIYLNAAIYGLNEKETKSVLDEIIDFADIGQFIDQPVGTYSSGMSSRLGFSIAVHVDCDIFLADEILAVGDKPFKRKCMNKMMEIRESGRTIVYVSHAAASVQKMCDRVIALERGRLVFDGDAMEGIRYLHYEDDGEEELGISDAELGADV